MDQQHLCDFPDIRGQNLGARWTCPTCGTRYWLRRRATSTGVVDEWKPLHRLWQIRRGPAA